MTLNESSSASAGGGWMTLKERGKAAYERGDYASALSFYSSALQPDLYCPAAEKQIILSNMVACRLQLGGPAQAEAAVETAKQCVALNDRWAKGHIRLASAYIALGGHSNDACNALQRAMQLDPGNPTAREMLVRELRRDRHAGNNSNSNTANNNSRTASHHPQPSAPPQNLDDQNYTSTRSTSTSGPDTANYGTTNYDNADTTRPFFQDNNNHRHHDHQDLDDSITWKDKIIFYYDRSKSWYLSQSDDVRTVLKVFLFILVLYVAFGGRFGLGSLFNNTTTSTARGNYNPGNVYDQYYGRRNTASSSTSSSSGYNGQNYNNNPRTSSSSSATYRDNNYKSRHNDYHHNQRYHDDYYYDHAPPHRSSTRQSTSFHFPDLFDGSIYSMFLLAFVAYMCHRNGINPFQALFFLNLMGGGHRRRHRPMMYGGGGMGMGGMGMGGMGYGRGGFGRPRRW